MNKLSEQGGFTLIEALIAMAVLTIGILALYTMQITAIQSNSTAGQITKAASAAANQVEAVFAMDYNDLKDLDNDGTNQDANNDGVDDTGDNFGLGDAGCCQNGNDPFGAAVPGCTQRADYCAPGQDGYAIYWNVADNEPMPETKRITVHVAQVDRGMRRVVSFDYIKAKVVQR